MLVKDAAISFRGVSSVLKILQIFFPQIKKVPSFTSVRLWVTRFGLNKMTTFREKAHDWAIIMDHTIQIGQLKVLIVLGIQLSKLPEERALSLKDVEPLLVLPMTSSTGARTKQVLEGLQELLGSIRLILADQGPDLKAGIKPFILENPSTDYIPDIVHTLGHMLHKEIRNDEKWLELSKKTSTDRTKLLQSRFSHLIPPQKRDKARYLNLEELIKWSNRILIALESTEFSKEDQEGIKKHFSWVKDLEDGIDYFNELWWILATTRDFIRVQGVTFESSLKLGTLLGNLPLSKRSLPFALKVIDFVHEQSMKAQPNERLPGSSEIIESLIGTLKHRLNSQSRSGFTTSVLMASTLAGEINIPLVHEAMNETSTKEVQEWSSAFIGDTIQKKRRGFYELTKSVFGFSQKNSGTENGNIITIEPELKSG